MTTYTMVLSDGELAVLALLYQEDIITKTRGLAADRPNNSVEYLDDIGHFYELRKRGLCTIQNEYLDAFGYNWTAEITITDLGREVYKDISAS